MKIAIIDIDGVISNSEARFAKAEEAKKQEEDRLYAEWHKMNGGRLITMERGAEFELAVKKQLDNVYWRTAFTPSLVALDTLIDGVPEVIESIAQAGYSIYFLTSRPESMRDATLVWIRRSPISWPWTWEEHLIMKPASQQYVKTVVWKAGVVEVLVRLFNTDDLLVVDDEHAESLAVDLAHLPGNKCFGASLKDALAMLEEK